VAKEATMILRRKLCGKKGKINNLKLKAHFKTIRLLKE
jgi:hypothetical protein